MIIGSMHHSNVVHIGRVVKTTADGSKLYAPFCRKMQPSNIAYLGIKQLGHAEAITCTRCQRKLQSHPHLFKD